MVGEWSRRRWRVVAAMVLALVSVPGAAGADDGMPEWVVDPARPGAHLPARGATLFDRLFARPDGSGHTLPFPFERLLERIAREVVAERGAGLPPIKAVLIPLGRSLQRTAAAPDYFTFPRVVATVDSLPVDGSTLLLKDRLYIGYQEKSAVLEVISYNEDEGRFEFQLVKDYRAGAQPRVFQANRNICFACHQNGAPIFSRALWDETHANPAIAARLKTTGRTYYGVSLERGVDLPYAIDASVRRANRLALAQRLWQQGCGDGDSGRACRAGLWLAALRLRLGDERRLPRETVLGKVFAADVAAPLLRTAARRWPKGLALGRPDLPNRNPLQGLAAWPEAVAAQVARSHVPAPFEPLLPRSPEEVWRSDDEGAAAAAVEAVAAFVVDGRWPRLMAALARRAGTLPRRVVTLDCAALPVTVPRQVAASRASASRCEAPDGSRLQIDWAAGRVEGLRLDGAEPHPAFALGEPAGRRLAGGDWLEKVDTAAMRNGAGRLSLVVRADGEAVTLAMRRVTEGAQGLALLDGRPLPAAALLDALLVEMGERVPARRSVSLPAPRLEVPAAAPGDATEEASPGLAGFRAWCAACHWSAEAFPPNFLQGPAAGLEARIRQCAPRIYVRLAMARLLRDARTKTPMPPETLLPAFGTRAEVWAGSAERAGLEAAVAAMLKRETGREPDLAGLLAEGYEALRPCLLSDRP